MSSLVIVKIRERKQIFEGECELKKYRLILTQTSTYFLKTICWNFLVIYIFMKCIYLKASSITWMTV
jgi:hypothetical protein